MSPGATNGHHQHDPEEDEIEDRFKPGPAGTLQNGCGLPRLNVAGKDNQLHNDYEEQQQQHAVGRDATFAASRYGLKSKSVAIKSTLVDGVVSETCWAIGLPPRCEPRAAARCREQSETPIDCEDV